MIIIECPNCKDLIEVEDEPAEDSACPACGQTLPRSSRHESETTVADHPREIGKFRLLKRVGVGAFGAVWKARDTELGRTVAVKLLHPNLVAGKSESERFYREARAAAQLRHPSIVTVHEVAELDGLPAIVSDFIEGMTLKELAALRRLGCREAAVLVAQVADALDYAHSLKIVHRDVKPGNIMVSFESGASLAASLKSADTATGSTTHPSRSSIISRQGPRALLLDFGLALREEGEATLTTEGQILGTPAYMSPEQAAGEGHRVDRRSDIYSLGVVLYELIAGEIPFRGSQTALLHQVIHEEPRRPRAIHSAVPRDLETICLKAMAKQRSSRYGAASELAADLRRFLAGDPILARPIGNAERLWRWCRRNPAVAALTAAVAAMLVLGTAVSLFFALRAEEARRAEVGARRAVELALADTYTASGIQAADLGKPAESLIWFAAASLRAAGEPERERDNRIRFWSWARQIPAPMRAFSSQGWTKGMTFHPAGRFLLIRNYAPSCTLWDLTGEQPAAFPGGETSVNAAEWNRDGTRLATGTREGLVGIYRFPSAELVTRFKHPGAVTAMSFNDDGRLLALASDKLRVWDCDKGAFVTPEYAHPDHVAEIAFNQHGDKVATACADGKCRVWPVPGDAGKTAPLFPPVAHVYGDPLTFETKSLPLLFLDRDRGLLTCPTASELAWIDSATGKSIMTMPASSRVWWLTPSPDRKHFVVCSINSAQLYETSTRKTVGAAMNHGNFVYAAAFHPDGRSLITVSADRTTRQWSVPNGAPLSSPLQHQDEVVAVAFSTHGSAFATAQMDGLVRVWKPKLEAQRISTGGVESYVQLSPDGRYALGVGWNHQRSVSAPHVFELESGQPAGPALDTNGLVNGGAFSPDARQVVLLASLPEHSKQRAPSVKLQEQSGRVHFYDWRLGKRLLESVTTPTEPIGVAVRPDGKQVAVVCAAGEILLIDPATGRVARQLHHGAPFIPSYMARDYVRYTPDGARFATWGLGTEVRVWDAESGRLVFTLSHPVGRFSDVVFSADGKLLATASMDKTIEVYDAANGRMTVPPMQHPDWVFTLCFSSDSKQILSACRDRMARLWDRESGKLACPPMSHKDEVFGVCFTHDGRWILTTSRDATTRVWDRATGKPMSPYLPESGRCYQVAVTSDDRRIVIAGQMAELVVHRLADLVTPDQNPLEGGDLQGLAEIISGLSLHWGGGIVNLTSAEWLERWTTFRGRNAAYPPLAYSP